MLQVKMATHIWLFFLFRACYASQYLTSLNHIATFIFLMWGMGPGVMVKTVWCRSFPLSRIQVLKKQMLLPLICKHPICMYVCITKQDNQDVALPSNIYRPWAESRNPPPWVILKIYFCNLIMLIMYQVTFRWSADYLCMDKVTRGHRSMVPFTLRVV